MKYLIFLLILLISGCAEITPTQTVDNCYYDDSVLMLDIDQDGHYVYPVGIPNTQVISHTNHETIETPIQKCIQE